MCAIEDSEQWDVFRAKTRTARKAQTCCECGRRIQVGEQHQYMTGLYDHQWSSFHQCRHCLALGAWMNAVCGGYPTQMLREELEDHWVDEGFRSIAFGRLIVAMRRKWHGGADPVPEGVDELARQMLAGRVAA